MLKPAERYIDNVVKEVPVKIIYQLRLDQNESLPAKSLDHARAIKHIRTLIVGTEFANRIMINEKRERIQRNGSKE